MALYQKACDGGNADGCLNLGVLYSRGQGALASGAAAAELYYKAGLAHLKDGDKANALLVCGEDPGPDEGRADGAKRIPGGRAAQGRLPGYSPVGGSLSPAQRRSCS